MSQTIEAVYDGAVLHPQAALDVEPNTRVRITVEALPAAPKPTKKTSFLDTARNLNLDGPPDWASNLESYLYGDADSPRG